MIYATLSTLATGAPHLKQMFHLLFVDFTSSNFKKGHFLVATFSLTITAITCGHKQNASAANIDL